LFGVHNPAVQRHASHSDPYEGNTPDLDSSKFTIIVLAMNRLDCLQNILFSIQQTDFESDSVNLQIRVDHSDDNDLVVKTAKRFVYTHGAKEVIVADHSLGLARSWFTAWNPVYASERAIIFEDDITLSPDWYKWLKGAWASYSDLPDLAGISLQRQTFVPYQPWRENFDTEIDGSDPLLFSLLGSIGYSPNPVYWRQFNQWTRTIDLDAFDVSTPGLVTSEWWNRGDKRQMWTQHFIYFTLRLNLYTLYAHLPNQETLAAHMRAKGAHIKKSLGADFKTAEKGVELNFPSSIVRYGWNGEENFDENESGKLILNQTLIHTAKRINAESGFVYLLFLNAGFLEMTKNWICNALRVANEIFRNVLFISTDTETTRKLSAFKSDLHIFTLASDLRRSVSFGSFSYYKVVLERLELQNMLLQEGINIQIIESDQFLTADMTLSLREKFSRHEIIAGQEGDYPNAIPVYICGGFLGIASSIRTRPFFSTYVSEYGRRLDERRGDPDLEKLLDFEDDQRTLTRVALESGFNIHFVDRCMYSNGLWFKRNDFSSDCPVPMVLHNGYIVGNDAKMRRAHETGRWYVSDDGQRCLHTM
jgi:hypothetical protein